MKPKLRVYFGPEFDVAAEADTQATDGNVTVPAGEIFPLLIDAIENDRTWLADFADDNVTISSDLYEVLLAYQHYRRPSA